MPPYEQNSSTSIIALPECSRTVISLAWVNTWQTSVIASPTLIT